MIRDFCYLISISSKFDDLDKFLLNIHYLNWINLVFEINLKYFESNCLDESISMSFLEFWANFSNNFAKNGSNETSIIKNHFDQVFFFLKN